MPLPKKLKRGASKVKKQKVIAATMHDLKHGQHHKDRTRAQEIAIAEKQAGNSKKSSADSQGRNLSSKTKPKRKAANRKSRNKGRH